MSEKSEGFLLLPILTKNILHGNFSMHLSTWVLGVGWCLNIMNIAVSPDRPMYLYGGMYCVHHTTHSPSQHIYIFPIQILSWWLYLSWKCGSDAQFTHYVALSGFQVMYSYGVSFAEISRLFLIWKLEVKNLNLLSTLRSSISKLPSHFDLSGKIT